MEQRGQEAIQKHDRSGEVERYIYLFWLFEVPAVPHGDRLEQEIA